MTPTLVALLVAIAGGWLATATAFALLLNRWMNACEECEERGADFRAWEAEVSPPLAQRLFGADRATD